jgi:hypothetical protein
VPPTSPLIAGRLALDFANLSPSAHDLSWDEFVSFLVDARLVSEDRAARLRPLLTTEPQAVDAVLLRILRFRESLRAIFTSIVDEAPFPASCASPKAMTNSSPAGAPGRSNSWPAKLVWTGFSPLPLAPLPNFSSKVRAHPFAAAPIPPAACSSTMTPARVAAAGAPCLSVAIATRWPLSSVDIPRAIAIPDPLRLVRQNCSDYRNRSRNVSTQRFIGHATRLLAFAAPSIISSIPTPNSTASPSPGSNPFLLSRPLRHSHLRLALVPGKCRCLFRFPPRFSVEPLPSPPYPVRYGTPCPLSVGFAVRARPSGGCFYVR